MFSMGLPVPPAHLGQPPPGTPGPTQACLIHAGAGGDPPVLAGLPTPKAESNTALLPQGSSWALETPPHSNQEPTWIKGRKGRVKWAVHQNGG